jgi:hypothetical protein
MHDKTINIISEKARLPVGAALDDMHWHIWESQAGAARHHNPFIAEAKNGR